jgi:hypothetical protein
MAKHLEELSTLEFANEVRDWILEEADADELQSMVAEWRGIPIDAVTVDTRADEIEIRPAEPVIYPTPEKALALIEVLRQIVDGASAVELDPDCGDYARAEIDHRQLTAAREALRNVGVEV